MAETNETEPKTVQGYIIMQGKDGYLSDMSYFSPSYEAAAENPVGGLAWTHDKEKIEDTRVFSEETVQQIKDAIKNDKWGVPLTDVVPATWSETQGVVITGEKISFDEVPLIKQ